MKKTTFIPTKAIIILFTLLVTLSASAQEIKKSSLTADDIAEALGSLGLTIDKFDFSAVDGQTRCCDDKLLSPDFKNDIFRNSPHYYVIGLKLSPR